jgi:hypothetical protein
MRPWNRVIEPSGHRAICDLRLVIGDFPASIFQFRVSIFNFLSSESAKGLIISAETVDKRCGGVCHAGVGSQPAAFSPSS